MAAVPIYVWNGTAWQETGPTIPASPIKYQASAPSSPSTGDIWVDSDADVTSGSQQFQRFRFVASGGETTISGNDANGATLAYTAGAELVVLNGSTLVRGQDYTATNGTSITGLSPALVANDVLEVFSFIAFSVANTYTQSQVDGLLDSYVGLRLITPTSVVSGTISSTGSVSFTTASSINLNGIFSSTYDNYLVKLDYTASASNGMYLRLRASGTDANGTDYFRQMVTGDGTTASGNRESSSTYYNFGYSNTGRSSATLEINSPFIARPTTGNTMFNEQTNSSGVATRSSSWGHNVSTAYDGMTIYPNTGTLTGSIRVYGYKN